jgi:hypothetical protein
LCDVRSDEAGSASQQDGQFRGPPGL